MSTRCQVLFINNSHYASTDVNSYICNLYRHHDGYPEEMIPCIKSVFDAVEDQYDVNKIRDFCLSIHDVKFEWYGTDVDAPIPYSECQKDIEEMSTQLQCDLSFVYVVNVEKGLGWRVKIYKSQYSSDWFNLILVKSGVINFSNGNYDYLLKWVNKQANML